MPDGEVVLDSRKMEKLRNNRYKIIGENKHSAVKTCHWTKNSVKSGERHYCYKQKFYGIKSHRCLQMTPSLPFCNLSCQFCWRDITLRNKEWNGNTDSAKQIIEESIKAQQELLSGLGGVEHSERHLKEANIPKHVAISLDGEPTLYPHMDEMIKEFHEGGMTTFLVTNGTNPDRIIELKEKNLLPTQLYVSVYGYDKDSFKITAHPLEKDAWEKLNKTLELLPTLETRKVIRLTLVKDLNMKHPEKWASLLKKSNVDFVECKAAMAVGFAKTQGRLKYEDMASHKEVKEFAIELAKHMGYEVVSEKQDSRVVLLSKSMEYYQNFPRLS